VVAAAAVVVVVGVQVVAVVGAYSQPWP